MMILLVCPGSGMPCFRDECRNGGDCLETCSPPKQLVSECLHCGGDIEDLDLDICDDCCDFYGYNDDWEDE